MLIDTALRSPVVRAATFGISAITHDGDIVVSRDSTNVAQVGFAN